MSRRRFEASVTTNLKLILRKGSGPRRGADRAAGAPQPGALAPGRSTVDATLRDERLSRLAARSRSVNLRTSLARTAGFASLYALATVAGRMTTIGDSRLALVWPAAGVA